MTVESEIKNALMERLASLTTNPVTQIAYPNIGYTPEIGTPYLRPSFLSVGTVQATLGSDGFNRHRGIFQVSVFFEAGTGEITATEIASQVAVHFKRGTVLSGDSVTVRIERPPTVETPIQEPSWLHIPVSINWFADAPNPD